MSFTSAVVDCNTGALNPCHNGGTCHVDNSEGTQQRKRCKCPLLYEGEHCQRRSEFLYCTLSSPESNGRIKHTIISPGLFTKFKRKIIPTFKVGKNRTTRKPCSCLQKTHVNQTHVRTVHPAHLLTIIISTPARVQKSGPGPTVRPVSSSNQLADFFQFESVAPCSTRYSFQLQVSQTKLGHVVFSSFNDIFMTLCSLSKFGLN